MARETVVILSDDIDGGEADETVKFGLDGRSYTIDLNEKNATMLREVLAQYVGAATLDRGQRTTTTTTVRTAPTRRSTHDVDAVRQWARGRGYQVADRGRIKGEILAEYEALHG